MSEEPRVLLVEDEADLVASVRVALAREGYAVEWVSTGMAALASVQRAPPAVVLLDRMLPDLPGTEVCRRLRADPATQQVPILMVTALGEDVDRVVGLEVGADDYLGKPYVLRELVLRVQALHRRASQPALRATQPAGVRSFGALRVDEPGWRAFLGEELLALTPQEFKLLLVFLDHAGQVLERRELVRHTWGAGHHITERAVDTHVRRLRVKLGAAGAYLGTLRQVGYRWAATPDETQ